MSLLLTCILCWFSYLIKFIIKTKTLYVSTPGLIFISGFYDIIDCVYSDRDSEFKSLLFY